MPTQIFMVVAMLMFFALGMGPMKMMMSGHGMQQHENHLSDDSTKTKKEMMKHHNDESKDGHDQHGTKQEAKEDSTAKKAWNTVCPVLGNEVDGETELVEYDGKLYGFCCPGCDTRFKKDPEKYSKNLSEDGTEFIKKKKK